MNTIERVGLAVMWSRAVRKVRSARVRSFGQFCNLSQAASVLYRLNRRMAEEWEHLDDFGSGHDCGHIVAKAQVEALGKFYTAVGMTEDEFHAVVVDRTSEKWAYVNQM